MRWNNKMNIEVNYDPVVTNVKYVTLCKLKIIK